MTLKNQLTILGLAMTLAFFAGRRSMNQSPSIDQTIKQDTSIAQQKQEDVKQNEKIVTVKEPNGETTTTETINTDTQDQTNTQTQIQTVTQTQTILVKKDMNVSLLASTNVSHLLAAPTYGVSVSKQILGPISAGLWGMTDGTIGISVGLDF